MPIRVTDAKGKIMLKDSPDAGHYKGFQIEPLQYIEANALDFNQGNIIKYVTRYREKGGAADLLKAKFYIERLIALEEARAALEKEKEEEARRLEEERQATARRLEEMEAYTYSAKDLTMKLEASIPDSIRMGVRTPWTLGPIHTEHPICNCVICKNMLDIKRGRK